MPTFVGLFSGCGGLDLGFEQAGFRCQLAVDLDERALAVHKANLSSPTLTLDLTNARPPDDILSSVDAFVCGPPCQGFSTIGGHRTTDPRNSLLVETAKLASIYRPPVVVIENVLGARMRLHSHHWLEAENLLRSSDYRTTTIEVDARRLGVPQTRRRILLLAWATGFEGEIDTGGTRKAATLDDVLRNVEGCSSHDPRWLAPGSRNAAIASVIKQGQKLCNVRTSESCVRTWDIPSVFGTINLQERAILEALVRLRRRNRKRDWGDADPVAVRELSHNLGYATSRSVGQLIRRGYLRRKADGIDLVHTFNGKYRRPKHQGLSPTVDTRFGDPQCFLHPTEDRAFTVREAARIQSFPDNFTFTGSIRSQYRMIGNAVPPTAACAVATAIRSTLLP